MAVGDRLDHRATMKDVARRAGVSQTTASFVMSGRLDMRISSETQKKVLQSAKDLGYRPNLMGRGLMKKGTQIIALLIDSSGSDQVVMELIRGCLSAAKALDHLLVVDHIPVNHDEAAHLAQTLSDRGVTSLLHVGRGGATSSSPEPLLAFPTVMVNCTDDDPEIGSVRGDDFLAGQLAAQTARGTDPGVATFLVGDVPAGSVSVGSRRAGVESVLRSQVSPASFHLACAWDPAAVDAAVGQVLDSDVTTPAFVCLTSGIAAGVYRAAYRRGLTIPEDVSVVAFDDSPTAALMTPPLTVVQQAQFEIGRRAVELLLTSSDQITHLQVAPEVLRRSSTR